MRKPRDYKAEYARRNARAQRQGYSGYGQKRRAKVKAAEWAERMAERMNEKGYFDMSIWEDDSFEDLIDHAESEFWEIFRNNYGKGATAA